MNKEEIDKWLDNEYGISYTRLEELHDFYFEKYCDLKQENKRLKEIIDKAIQHIENTKNKMIIQDRYYIDGDILLEILKGEE